MTHTIHQVAQMYAASLPEGKSSWITNSDVLDLIDEKKALEVNAEKAAGLLRSALRDIERIKDDGELYKQNAAWRINEVLKYLDGTYKYLPQKD
jgi:hypothetical protein